jgi:pimeloyl-ACP methyl ester carboxylesterase
VEEVLSVEHVGRRLAWRESGSGPTLLLLQGYGGTAVDWDPTFVAGLTETFRVVRPDPRGMGASTLGDPGDPDGPCPPDQQGEQRPGGPLTVASMADDAVVVLEASGGGAAVVVGWSMGGFVAQALACAAPERVAGLALISTDAGGPDAVLADPEVWARLVDDSGTPREQASRLLHLLFPMPLADTVDAEVGDLVAVARAALDPAVLRLQEAAIDEWHVAIPPAVPSVVPPTIVVAGSDDAVIPAANASLIAARWPGARTVTFSGAGHAVMAQRPAEVVDLVRPLAI